MRLDKFLSKATELSRKDCKKILHAGEVTVNGEVVKDSSLHIDEVGDDIEWAGEPLSVAMGNRYLLLYKPEGFECTLKPKEWPIVTDLIDVPQLGSLRIAGRLDVDTTGALLLSDDGGFLHRVTSPKHHVAKVYELTLAEPMTEAQQAFAIKELAKGIMLEDEYDKTKPAELSFSDATHAKLVLTEGKYHQVKRMVAAAGNRVEHLHRLQFGPWDTQDLQAGEWRFVRVE